MEAACGPSTPVSLLRKHAAADRSIQDDRMRTVPGSLEHQSNPSSHFRSVPDEQAQKADSDFPDFLSLTSGSYDSTNWVIRQGDRSHFSNSEHWMSEHERQQNRFHSQPQGLRATNLSETGQALGLNPIKIQSINTNSISLANSWHHEFLQTIESSDTSFTSAGGHSSLPVTYHNNSALQHDNYMQQRLIPRRFTSIGSQTGNLVEGHSTLQLALADQNQKFDEMFDIIEAMNQVSVDSTTTVRDGNLNSVSRVESGVFPPPENSKAIINNTAPNDDGLAAIAGEVLESLNADSTNKFKDSTFLALMRQLRDRDVIVKDGRMVHRDFDITEAETEFIKEGPYYLQGDNGALDGLDVGGEFVPSAYEAAKAELGDRFRAGAWEESL
ncbi:uncharacterized protein V1516DRAFT_673942 [Lipomyces oligophaga]|uniref:uncharacterized protein n=1 Tax=Lipomyces oligophaga TaxID=45792 RepID=UPI0034CFBFC2